MAVATGSLAAVEQPVASRRLTSLDVVRGLAVAVMVIVENLPGPLESFRWWRHAAWHGLTIADVVFPLFLVATGAGMAFWLRPPVSARTLRRLAVRSLALIAIGVVVFSWWGEGGGLDSLRIPGVLQRIGVAGLIGGVVVAGLRRWWAIAAVVALLLVGYGWTLTSPTVDGCRGVDVPECTVPGSIDAATFGPAHLYRDGDAGYDPEGLPSTAGAVASVLIGWLAGDLLRRRRLPELAGLGAVCFGAGLLWSPRDRGQQAALDALVRARDRRDLNRVVARRTRGRRPARCRGAGGLADRGARAERVARLCRAAHRRRLPLARARR